MAPGNNDINTEGSMANSFTRKPKILCLHGAGGNNSMSEFLAEMLKLTTRFECVFIHAPHETRCYNEKGKLFNGPFYSWASLGDSDDANMIEKFRKENVSYVRGQWDGSLECLAEFCNEHGPFDGVFGVSQGAAIATDFSHPTIWKDRFHMEQCPWKFAILGIPGGDVTIEKDATLINLPSFHIFGEKEERRNKLLPELFWDPSQKVTCFHSGGHDLSPLLWTPELMELLDQFVEKQNVRIRLKSLDEELEQIQHERERLQKMLLDCDKKIKAGNKGKGEEL
jgi:hypothetical protein